MSAGVYNLNVEQGSTYTRVFTWSTGTSGCGGTMVPVDLMGYTAIMQIRSNVSSPTVLFEASTANSKIVLGGDLGTITLTIPAADSASWTFLTGVYDLELTAGTNVTRLLQGKVSVSREVTR